MEPSDLSWGICGRSGISRRLFPFTDAFAFVPKICGHKAGSFQSDPSRRLIATPPSPGSLLAVKPSGKAPTFPRPECIKYGAYCIPRAAEGLIHHPTLPLPSAFCPTPTLLSAVPAMERDPSYPTQSCSVPAVLDHSPPSFSWDVAHSLLLQGRDPGQMLYGAECYSDGEDVPPQHRTIPPLTRAPDIGQQFLTHPVLGCGHPVNLSEDCQYYPSRLTRISALAPPQEACGTQGHAPRSLHVADRGESLVGSMPPNVHPLPHTQAYTLNQRCPVWNTQNLGADNADASYSPHPAEKNGETSMLPPFKSLPHDTPPRVIDDTIEIDGLKWTAEYGHANSINLGTPIGHPRSRALTFCGPHESQTPLPYAVPPFGHVLTACGTTPAYPPIAPDIINETIMNVETIPLPLDYTAPQPGGGNDHEWMGGIYHPSGELAPLSYRRPCNVGIPSMHERPPEADHPRVASTMNVPVAYVACDRTAPKLCGWRDINGGTCDMPVTYDTVPHHLRTFHGIEGMAANVEIECRWCSPPKTLRRKHMVKHFREAHLKHPRRKSGVTQSMARTSTPL
ncbi:hypothetical protein F5141DRAFT_80733 [Pisolithus sp. B1]|nr:hypothetical protein F5141DRAFT_80733 [Pisolithus sp. B1]